jgi:uncharacterized protein (TIGR02118 family)
VIALLAKKPGMPHEDFVRYYETRHVPLIRSCFQGIRDYRRNFISLDGAIMAPGMAAPDFDVVTELWFDDRAAYEAMLAAHGRPDVGGRIAEDEENFLDRSRTRFFVVEERS